MSELIGTSYEKQFANLFQNHSAFHFMVLCLESLGYQVVKWVDIFNMEGSITVRKGSLATGI